MVYYCSGSSLRFATLAQRRGSLWAMFPSIESGPNRTLQRPLPGRGFVQGRQLSVCSFLRSHNRAVVRSCCHNYQGALMKNKKILWLLNEWGEGNSARRRRRKRLRVNCLDIVWLNS